MCGCGRWSCRARSGKRQRHAGRAGWRPLRRSVPLVQVFLETERLTLRRFTADDVDKLVELDSDPQVMYYITGGRATPREEIEREELPHFLECYKRYDGYGFWAALEKSSGEFIGWFHLRPRREGPSDEPELGYRLRRSAWG